ncbi:4Fe-4S dicluster domain-containing protein [bacterium]|nr:4Fe-4S dicluster domain-containing protein [bacterium]
MAHVEIDAARCKACRLCIAVCPKKMLRPACALNARGVYPTEAEDPAGCLGCLQCVLVCPDAAITVRDDKAKKARSGK